MHKPEKIRTSITEYSSLVRHEAWIEGRMVSGRWVFGEPYGEPACSGVFGPRLTEGEVWTEALQKAMDENSYVYVPPMPKPLYIDKALVISSGTTLEIYGHTMIRLKPGSNTAMIRNKKAHYDLSKPINCEDNGDSDIHIIGGIWSECNNGRYGGNDNHMDMLPEGNFGVMVLSNVTDFSVENVTFTDCTAFGIMAGACKNFLIENIKFDVVYRDGVHLNGPAQDGVIRNIVGECGDDIVAVNAWDWHNSAKTLGNIENIQVEGVRAKPGHMFSGIRLLAGRKYGDDSHSYECSIRNCTFSKMRGLNTVIMYMQPFLTGESLASYSNLGVMENIIFSDIEIDYIKPEDYYFEKHAAFEIGNHCNRVIFENITVNFPLRDTAYGNWSLVAVGRELIDITAQNEDYWRKLPPIDRHCIVRDVTFRNIYCRLSGEKYRQCADLYELMDIKTDKGETAFGTVYGIAENIVIDDEKHFVVI